MNTPLSASSTGRRTLFRIALVSLLCFSSIRAPLAEEALPYKPSAQYVSRIVMALKRNVVYTEDPTAPRTAEVEVSMASDGVILTRRLLRSSGVDAWDRAVLTAIDRTARLPLDNDGHVPPIIVIAFSPNVRN
jgi:TonB family protein